MEILERVSKSLYFSGIDLKKGYWQRELVEECIPLTAFVTPFGHFECTRVPFGIKNAPKDFSHMMTQALGQFKDFTEIYLDDVIIRSSTFEDHMIHIAKVLDRLKEVNLKLNHAKCKWVTRTLRV